MTRGDAITMSTHGNGPSGPSTGVFPSRTSTVHGYNAHDVSPSTSIHAEQRSPANLENDTGTHHGHERKKFEEAALKLTDQTNLLPFRKVVSVFLGLAVCIVVSTLDMTLVATALPSISAHFHAGMCS